METEDNQDDENEYFEDPNLKEIIDNDIIEDESDSKPQKQTYQQYRDEQLETERKMKKS